MTTKKSICMIRSNPVNPDSRVEKEAWSLIEAGHKVHILAWDRDSNHRIETKSISVMNRSIPITLIGYKAGYAEGKKTLVAFLKFQLAMRHWLRKHISQFDVVHACDYDTAIMAFSVVKRGGKAFVFDIFDFLYPEPKGFVQGIVRWLQLHVINIADATIVCSEERIRQIQGSNPRNLTVIHNTPLRKQASINSKIHLTSNDTIVKVVYVGILQDDDRLLKEIANVIARKNNIEFHVAGFGQLEQLFVSISAKYSNIHFYGRIPYDQGLALEKQCNIMIAMYNPKSENNRNAAPNKFYEALMLGKPIIVTKEMGIANIVRDMNIGCAANYSEQGFEAALDQLIVRRSEWPEMSKRMKDLYAEKYNWNIMANRLNNLYDSL